MKLNDFVKEFKLQYNDVQQGTYYLFRLNLIERDGLKLIAEKTLEERYSVSKFKDDLINQNNGVQIGPYKNYDEIVESMKRQLVERLFRGYIVDFHPLDRNNDIEFLFE
jgi:hypothetical protein